MNKWRKRIVWIAIFGVVAVGSLWLNGCNSKKQQSKSADIYYCPMHPTYTSDRPGDCPICNMKLVKKEASAEVTKTKGTAKAKDIYYCPMHPTYTSDRPGDCPICNMKLVKKEPKSPAVSPTAKSAQASEDICILHDCHKHHGDQPCPMMVIGKEGEEIHCPVCGSYIVGKEKQLKKILYWTDPMTPGLQSEKPGASPQGNKLIPVFEETPAQETQHKDHANAAGYTSIMLSPQKRQLIGITTGIVQKQTIERTIRVVGTVAHDPQLYQAQAEYLQAHKAYQSAQRSSIPGVADQAKRMLEASRIRLRHLGWTDDLIEELTARQEAEHSLLYAHAGEAVWIYAQVYEYELPSISKDQTVKITAPSMPGETFEGTIRSIDPMVDEATRTTRLRIRLNNAEGLLKPAMYVDVGIALNLQDQLTVPQEAVLNTGTQTIVFVEQGEGIFEPRNVQLGSKADDVYIVQKGLHEGEQVVTSGNFLIDSESRLQSALEGMTEGAGGQHVH